MPWGDNRGALETEPLPFGGDVWMQGDLTSEQRYAIARGFGVWSEANPGVRWAFHTALPGDHVIRHGAANVFTCPGDSPRLTNPRDPAWQGAVQAGETVVFHPHELAKTPHDLAGAAEHEAGHVLGLGHTAGLEDVMYPTTTGLMPPSARDLDRLERAQAGEELDDEYTAEQALAASTGG